MKNTGFYVIKFRDYDENKPYEKSGINNPFWKSRDFKNFETCKKYFYGLFDKENAKEIGNDWYKVNDVHFMLVFKWE